MDYMSALIEHQKTARGELTPIEVAELPQPDGKPTVFYYYPGLDVAEYEALLAEIDILTGIPKPSAPFVAARWLLRDETGRRIFEGAAAYQQLREKASPDLVADIVKETNWLNHFFDIAPREEPAEKKP